MRMRRCFWMSRNLNRTVAARQDEPAEEKWKHALYVMQTTAKRVWFGDTTRLG